MQCTFCGHPLSTELRCCPICGTKILVSRRLVPAAPSVRHPPPAPLPSHQSRGQQRGVRRKGCVWAALGLSLAMLSLPVLLLTLLEHA